jgi:predicted Zn-dependent peptidase
MIQFSRHTLSNGLRILVHEDSSSPLVALSVTYSVGSRNDDPNRTGFAHLFEHLMFGGSANAPNFDDPIQEAGGDSNAFTNNDYTCYYESLPAENLETALWLEADRMGDLVLTRKPLMCSAR